MFGLVSKKKYKQALRKIEYLKEELERKETLLDHARDDNLYLRRTRFLPEDLCKYVEMRSTAPWGPICKIIMQYAKLLDSRDSWSLEEISKYRQEWQEKHKNDRR